MTEHVETANELLRLRDRMDILSNEINLVKAKLELIGEGKHQCLFVETISRVNKTVYGNGDIKESLVWIAQDNRRMILDIKSFVDWIKTHIAKLIWVCVLGSLSAIGVFATKIYQFVLVHHL